MKFYYFFILLISSSLAYAIDYNIGQVSECSSPITLSIEGAYPIDIGEYSVNCPNSSNLWICSCDSPMIMSVKSNTINNYTIHATYTVEEMVRHSGGGGGGYYPTVFNQTKNITINISKNNSNTPVYVPPIYTPSPILNLNPDINTDLNIYNTPNTTGQNPSNTTGQNPLEKHRGIFYKIFQWIKKILLYKLW